MKLLHDMDMDGRAVLMRLDLNVPMRDGVITSDARIRAALPTIRAALDGGARLAIASHFGRPKGKPDPAFSLETVGAHLAGLLGVEVLFVDACVGDGVRGVMQGLRAGQLVLLENLRFDAGETAGDKDFARSLAAPFQLYVNDAFGAAHRRHASIVGVPAYVEDVAAGPLMAEEVNALKRLLSAPRTGFCAVVGGAKVSDKLGVLRALLERVDTLCIGGAMAYTFLAAGKQEVGSSRVEDDQLAVAARILTGAAARGVKILLPVDHVVATSFDEHASASVVTDIPPGAMGLDIGPQTSANYTVAIKAANHVFWNGPMGVFEWESFAKGTHEVARAMANAVGYTVVGGGDSLAALEATGLGVRMDHVSTGGGASLEFLQHGSLPGIDALTSFVKKEAQTWPEGR